VARSSPQGCIAKAVIAETLLMYCLHSGGVWRPRSLGLGGWQCYHFH